MLFVFVSMFTPSFSILWKMEMGLDPIIQAVLDSKRLTFEDETTIRHRMGQIKLEKRESRTYHTAVSTALLVSGGFFHYHDRTPRPGISKNIPTSFGKLLLTLGGLGAAGILAKDGLRILLNNSVKQFLTLLHETSNLSRKTGRWILDNEVLQRGGYSVSAVARDGPSTGNVLSLKACLRLRRSAFIESRSMVFILRAVAVDLLSALAAEKSLDPLETHICLIPLIEFGDSLSISECDLEALYLSTDGFSLQATKSLTGLLDLQVSEFLKLLCCQRLGNSGFWKDFGLLKRLKRAHFLFMEAFNRLEMEYRFETDEPFMAASLRRPSTVPGIGHPPDYLRSLELHLTAALKDLRTVLSDTRQPDELQKVAEQDRLEKLGYHVKCCAMLLDYVKRKSLCEPAQTPSTDDPDVSPTRSDFELQPAVSGDDEIPVEDDIFEALVMSDAEAVHRGEPVFSQMNHWQEQKQQSKMVLDEIKTLLSVRSADWNERERKVRERKGMPVDGVDEEAVVPTTSCDQPDDAPVSPDQPDFSPETIFNAAQMAKAAAALGTRWQGGAEEQFGSDESNSESE